MPPAHPPRAAPEPSSPDGAVGAEPRAAPEAAARPGVAEKAPRRRRVLYLLDWFAPHQSQLLKDIVAEAGHAILLIGGHLTGLVQVEDTHLHGPMTMYYKRRETASAMQQLRIRPDKLPSTCRQTVMERAYDSYMDVDHSRCSHGFVANGIANALDGSQDCELTPDVLPFWMELDMPSVRRRIMAEVDEALSHGRVTRFEDYVTLLEEYKYHKAFSEGQEAFGVEVRADGAIVEEPPMSDASDGEETGACDARGEASEEDGGAEPRGDPDPHAPVEERPVATEDDEDVQHVKAAHTTIEAAVQQEQTALQAALVAVQSVGGSEHTTMLLSNRLEALARRTKGMTSDLRARAHALQMQRHEEILVLREADKAREAEEKKLKAEIALRKKDAEIARSAGVAAAAEARQKLLDLEARKRAEKARKETEKERESLLRTHYAAHLAEGLQRYLYDADKGAGRSARLRTVVAKHIAKRRGEVRVGVPMFWGESNVGLRNVTHVPHGKRRRGTQGADVHASPSLSDLLFKSGIIGGHEPKYAFKRLLQALCPMYFDLFHVRYGMETLLTDSRHNLDLAFVAAVWRYTHVVGKEQYRFGVDAWPPPADWSTGLVAATTVARDPSSAEGAAGAAASGSEVADAARASGAEPRAEGTGSKSSGSGGTKGVVVGPRKHTSR